MNIIVTNKYRDLIYNSNIEVLKESHGVFKVGQIVNSFNSIFYKKIIIDATAILGFPKEDVLKELIASFDSDKLILFLPPDNPPPKKFLSFLVNIGLYNFTDNPNGLIELVRRSNTINNVQEFMHVEEEEKEAEEDLLYNDDAAGRIIIGFKSVTDDSYITEIIYSIKSILESKYKKDVVCVEVNKRNFTFYNSENMYSISSDKYNEFVSNNQNCSVMLVDLDNFPNNKFNDIVYLVNPSLYCINKLLLQKRDAFIKLKGEKIVFVNSLLSSNDVIQFAKEANISVYYNLSPVNDRVDRKSVV